MKNINKLHKVESGFPIIFFLYFINIISFINIFFNNKLRAGAIASIIIVCMFLLVLPKISLYRLTLINIVFIFYFFWGIFSIFFYIFNNVDIKFVLSSISYLIIPMLLFILSYIYANKDNYVKIIKVILINNFIVIIVGFILYAWMPSFFLNYLNSSFYALANYNGNVAIRLHSYLNSMIVGNISLLSVSLLLFMVDIKKIAKRIFFLLIIILVIAVFFSFARSAMVGLFLIGVILLFKKRNFITIALFLLAIIVLYLILINPALQDNGYVVKINNRINNLGIAVSDRNFQWQYGLKTFYDNPLGIGIGLASHKAILYDNKSDRTAVPDGNYFRILVELGILGIMFFMIFLSLILFKASKISTYLFLVVLFFAFQSFGNNFFDLFYSSHLFWILCGLIAKISSEFEKSKYYIMKNNE